MELSIDTSTRFASVVISKEGQLIDKLSWKSQRNHSVELVPSIFKLSLHKSVFRFFSSDLNEPRNLNLINLVSCHKFQLKRNNLGLFLF